MEVVGAAIIHGTMMWSTGLTALPRLMIWIAVVTLIFITEILWLLSSLVTVSITLIFVSTASTATSTIPTEAAPLIVLLPRSITLIAVEHGL